MCILDHAEHTDVNDPLFDGWLACVPVIPEAELHFWALVVLKNSHHHCLRWKKTRNSKHKIHLCAFVLFLTPADIFQLISALLNTDIFHSLVQILPFSFDSADKELYKAHHTFSSPLFSFLTLRQTQLSWAVLHSGLVPLLYEEIAQGKTLSLSQHKPRACHVSRGISHWNGGGFTGRDTHLGRVGLVTHTQNFICSMKKQNKAFRVKIQQ